MKTFTTEHTVYTFDELSEEAQAVAIENKRQYEYEYGYEWLEDDMTYYLGELLAENNITDKGVTARYSLGYSQGDGASFVGDIEYKGYRATIATNQWGSHYSHSKTVDVKEMNSLKTDKDAPDKKWAELQNLVEAIGNDLEKYGYDCIETNQSDENIIELLSNNDQEYNKDGTIA